MGKKIAAVAALATGAFVFASAGPAVAGTGQAQALSSSPAAIQHQQALSGPISSMSSPQKCSKNVCLILKTSSFKKKGKTYVKVINATVQMLGTSSGVKVTLQYYGGGKKRKSKLVKCSSICYQPWKNLNYTYRKGTRVYGKAIKSGVNEGTPSIKL